MKLTEFIDKHRKKIINEWVEFARSLLPWSQGLSDTDLRDHADELLTAVINDMESAQTVLEQSEKSKGRGVDGKRLTLVGHRHASDRLESGFKLDQLVSEYRALRASVVRLWAIEHGDKQGELTRFNEAIDQTLAEGAIRYSELLNHTREQFLAILGHDLRNPLAAITMGAALLSKSEAIDDKEARVATRILSSAERMSRMVGYLLDLARTRLGSAIPLARSRMDLTPVCQQVVAELAVVYPEGRLKFEAKGDLVGDWDADRLNQVVSNLVANGLQHGEPPVTLLAVGLDDNVLVQVHNGGAPIAEGALKKIFEPMVRELGENGGDKNATGLGLGLYIAHEVVAAHGGTLGVASTASEGTTFTVQLPRHAKKRSTDPAQQRQIR